MEISEQFLASRPWVRSLRHDDVGGVSGVRLNRGPPDETRHGRVVGDYRAYLDGIALACFQGAGRDTYRGASCAQPSALRAAEGALQIVYPDVIIIGYTLFGRHPRQLRTVGQRRRQEPTGAEIIDSQALQRRDLGRDGPAEQVSEWRGLVVVGAERYGSTVFVFHEG